jgi:molybdopterin molybdotransferase
MTENNYSKSISYSHAIKTIQQQASGHQLGVETVSLQHALHRTVISNILSPVNVPALDCSQMDGYAIRYEDYRNNREGKFLLSAPLFAGDAPISQTHDDNQSVATPVMTGAVLPADTDTVVMKEHVNIEKNAIRFNQAVNKYQYIRKAGSDLKQNQLLIKKNHKITAADLGLLASVGIAEVEVFKQPKVALMMTGDELVSPGETCQPGQVFDSISLMLTRLLQRMGCEVTSIPPLSDKESMIHERFKTIKAQSYDLIVSVGGVSMGDRDLIPAKLAAHGQIYFHKTLIKPGFPLLFGQLGDALYFGLPGNPVSAFATSFQFIYPAVLSMRQSEHKTPSIWRAELLQDVNKTHMKREFIRGRYDVNNLGGIEVMVCGEQQSSRIKSLSEANCFIVMNESQLELKKGQTVVIQPFNQLY